MCFVDRLTGRTENFKIGHHCVGFHLVNLVNPVNNQKQIIMLALFTEIIATYQRHGWKVQRVLLRAATRADLAGGADDLFKGVQTIDSDFDALWFARPSHDGREAWELRLAREQPYALFKAFAADESEADREAERVEMEGRMREQALK